MPTSRERSASTFISSSLADSAPSPKETEVRAADARGNGLDTERSARSVAQSISMLYRSTNASNVATGRLCSLRKSATSDASIV